MPPRQTNLTSAFDRARRAIEHGVTLVVALLLFSLAHSGGISLAGLLSLFSN